MQASKIIPGTTYAFKRDGQLLRFYVSEVVTITRRRGVKANPHDHESVVHGRSEDDSTVTKINPDQLLGEYKDYSELVARQQQERAAAEQKSKNEKKAAHLLARRFYEIAELPMPEDLDARNLPFTIRGGTLQIEKDGIGPLLSALTTQAAISEVMADDAYSDAKTWKGKP